MASGRTAADGPWARDAANAPWAGFSATATVLRSDYDMGMFVPYVSDEVQVNISIEAQKAE